MRIHYYKQFFPSDASPGSAQPRALVKSLADRGHDVTVIACDFDGYTEATEPAERYGDPTSGGSFTVIRLRAPRQVKRSLVRRLVSYSGFMARAFWCGYRLPKPEVIIGSIQPLFTGLAAQLVASRRGTPLLLEVRDLWPDALEVKGAVTGWKAKPLHGLANRLYSGADRIVSSTPGIKTELVKKGLSPTSIDVFPNGFLPEMADIAPGTREDIRRRYGWNEDFVALYTGTHAEVVAIDVLVKAAGDLTNQDIRLECFGSGPTKDACITLAKDIGADQIHFHEPVPLGDVGGLLEACDIALMALFDSPLVHIYFQNKFMTYLGMGKPIFASMEGDQADLIREIGCGTVVPTYDHVSLARAIEHAAKDPAQTQQMGKLGQDFVNAYLVLPKIIERYAEVVEEVAQGDTAGLPAWDPLEKYPSDSVDGRQEKGRLL